jgi:hypothetical protein
MDSAQAAAPASHRRQASAVSVAAQVNRRREAPAAQVAVPASHRRQASAVSVAAQVSRRRVAPAVRVAVPANHQRRVQNDHRRFELGLR